MKTYQLYRGGRGNGGRNRDLSADDLERDLGDIRSEMSTTLRAIESKLSGGDVVGKIVGQLRGESADSGELLRNVGSVARANPIPVALIATGLGAMLLAGQVGTSAAGGRVRDRARERVDRFRAERAEARERRMESRFREGGTGEHLRESARETADDLRGRARGARERAGERLGHAQERFRERGEHAKGLFRERGEHARDRFSHGRDRAREGWRTASHQSRRMIEDEPLVLAGLGVALGATIAAAIPIVREERDRYARTRAEREAAESAEERSYEEVQVAAVVTEPGVQSYGDEYEVGPRPESPDDPDAYR